MSELHDPAPFLSRTSTGSVVAALATLLGDDLRRRLGAPPAASASRRTARLPHFAPKAKRVIYLFQSGGPSQHRPVRPQAEARRSCAAGAARLGPEGPAAHRHDRGAGRAFPSSPSLFKFAQHGQSRARGSASCCRTPRRSPTSSASSSRCTPRRSTTTRRSRSSRPGASSPAGRAWASWLAYGLGSENENLPAFVVMISQGTGNRTTSRCTTGCGAAASCRRSYQGVKFRSRGDPVLYLPIPPASTRRARRRLLDDLAELNDQRSRGRRRSRDRTRASRSTRWPSACRRRVPELTDLSKEPERTSRALRPRRRASPAPSPRNCLLARRLAERGVRFIQLYPPRLGPPRRPAHAASARRPATSTSRPPALVSDLKQRGPARRHAGRLGRRVRPHRLLPGQARPPTTTAATTTRAASPSGWPAAASSRA